MNKTISVSFSLLATILISSCAHNAKPVTAVDPLVFNWIQSTVPDSAMTGKASFWPAQEGVKIRVVVTGAKPGLHGIHIHEKGDCSEGGNAAGGHFNPDNVKHGDILKDGMKHAHPGDLGNISVDSTGLGSLEVFVPQLTLDGAQYGIAGRSIIIHEKTDDFGQPTGNAGNRVACAVIPNSVSENGAPAKPTTTAATTPSTQYVVEEDAAPRKKRFWLF